MPDQNKEETYRQIVEHIDDVLWACDIDMNLTYISPSVEKISGFTVEEKMAQSLEQRMTLPSLEKLKRITREQISNKTRATPASDWPIKCQLDLYRKGGSTYPVETIISFISDSKGGAVGLVGSHRDSSGSRQAEDVIRAIHEATLESDDEEFFSDLVSQLRKAFDVRYVFIARVEDNIVHTLAFCKDGNISKNFQYVLSGTPCENVVGKGACCYPNDVAARFPDDPMLTSFGVTSYMGTPIMDDANNVQGLLVLMDDKPVEGVEILQSALEIFAYRAKLELNRREVETRLVDSEAGYRALFDQSVNALFVLDQDGRFINVNDKVEDVFGYSPTEMSKVRTRDLLPDDPKHIQVLQTAFKTALSTGSVRFEISFKRKSGAIFPAEVTTSLIQVGDRKITQTMIHDLTESRQAQQDLLKLSRAVEASSSAVVITDLEGGIEYVNPKFTEITGYSSEEVIGKTTSLLSSGETPRAVYDELWEALRSKGEWKGELYDKKKDGSYFWCRNVISAVRNPDGEISYYVTIQDDVSYEHQLSEQLTYQASHDALTGLINRREFERRTELILLTLKQDQADHALCYLDLDQFKVINDTLGHAAGDELLRQLGSVLQKTTRQSDTLARLGGDEFAVLMERCSLENAQRVATSLLEAVRNHQFVWEGQTFTISASIGLVAINEATPTLLELLKKADAACYMAKDLGRNRIHAFHIEDTELAQRQGEMQWVSRIHRAMEKDQFTLYAQVIEPLKANTDYGALEEQFCLYAQSIDALETNASQHYELLLRLRGDKGEIISPGAFLPAAERYDLITQLDKWVVGETIRLMLRHPEFVKHTHFLAVNLSGASLAEESFLDFVIKALSDSRIDQEKICFEITETAAIGNLNAAQRFIKSVKALGCKFSLDDFGSGLSSFGYLKNLPVDYLKIDGMFVKAIVDDPIDFAMVKAINEIGHVMGMQTIAEFVENDEIKEKLREIGVDYVQGYGIAKPLPFEELVGQSFETT